MHRLAPYRIKSFIADEKTLERLERLKEKYGTEGKAIRKAIELLYMLEYGKQG